MPSVAPPLPASAARQLQSLGAQLRGQRLQLGLSATAAAQAAGLSRVTLYRMESGSPAVTMGAYLHVMGKLGLELKAGLAQPAKQVDY